MKNKELLKELNQAVFFFKQKKLNRFAQKPLKFISCKILEIYASWTNRPLKMNTKVFWGDNFKIVFPELISMNLFKYGFYEESLSRIFIENLKANMVLFDIGAHFGYYSLLGSLLVGEHGAVHSFEPSITTYNILRENTACNKYIKVNNLGVSDTNKQITINDYGIRYSAFNSLYNPKMAKKIEAKQYVIDCISIDDYVQKENISPNFIKIDAESSENEIINGMINTMMNYKPMITMEVGDFNNDEISKNIDVIKKILSFGYTPYECLDNIIIEHKLKDGDYKFNNLLFLPN